MISEELNNPLPIRNLLPVRSIMRLGIHRVAQAQLLVSGTVVEPLGQVQLFDQVGALVRLQGHARDLCPSPQQPEGQPGRSHRSRYGP